MDRIEWMSGDLGDDALAAEALRKAYEAGAENGPGPTSASVGHASGVCSVTFGAEPAPEPETAELFETEDAAE